MPIAAGSRASEGRNTDCSRLRLASQEQSPPWQRSHRLPARRRHAPTADPLIPRSETTDHAAGIKKPKCKQLAAAMPHNPLKAGEHGFRQRPRSSHRPARRGRVRRGVGEHRVGGQRHRQDRQRRRRGLERHHRELGSRARRRQRARPDHQLRRLHRRQPELAEVRHPRAGAAGGLHPAREGHPLRPRAHPRAHRARTRLRRARLFRVHGAAHALHAGRAVPAGWQGHAGVRALFHRGRRTRLEGHGARRARLCRQVLHRPGQLGPGGQQHAGVLHPGCDEVPRPRARGQARAAPRACRRRRARTTPSGTSCR